MLSAEIFCERPYKDLTEESVSQMFFIHALVLFFSMSISTMGKMKTKI